MKKRSFLAGVFCAICAISFAQMEPSTPNIIVETETMLIKTVPMLYIQALNSNGIAPKIDTYRWLLSQSNASVLAEDYLDVLLVNVLLTNRTSEAASVDDFLEIYKCNPATTNIFLRNSLAWGAFVRGMPAEQALSYVDHLTTTNSSVNDTKAWLCFKCGRKIEALHLILKALTADEGSHYNPIILSHAGDIFYANGFAKEALNFWKLAVSSYRVPENTTIAIIEGFNEDLTRKKIRALRYTLKHH